MASIFFMVCECKVCVILNVCLQHLVPFLDPAATF